MKIAILDFIFPRGHKFFNSKIVELLSRDYETIIAENINMRYEEKGYKKILVPDFSKFAKGKVTARLVSAFYMIYERIRLNNEIEDIILLNFDLVVFAFLKKFYRNKNIHLFHHQYIDELRNSKKRKIFQSYMNDIIHLVFADFMKDYLVNDIGVDNRKVFVIPHPVSFNAMSTRNDFNKKHYNLVGISQSNDNTWIESIIEEQRKDSFLQNHGKRMILKSNKLQYLDESLCVENKFYHRDEYDSLYENAEAILLLFPKSYEYRMSGTLFDAFLKKKPVIAVNIKVFRQYARLYPNNIRLFDNIEELKDIISKNISFSEEEFRQFFLDHNDEKVLCSLRTAISKEARVS